MVDLRNGKKDEEKSKIDCDLISYELIFFVLQERHLHKERTVGADRVRDYAAIKSPPQITASSRRLYVLEGKPASDQFDYEVARAGLFPKDSVANRATV